MPEASQPIVSIPAEHRRWFSVLLTVCIMLPGWLLCFFLDEVLAGVEVFGRFLPGLPATLAFAICLACGKSIWALNKAQTPWVRGRWCALFLIPVLWIYFCNGDTRKPFLKDLALVKTAMSHEEVEMIMGGYIEGSGFPDNPFAKTGVSGSLMIPNSLIFRHTREGWGNADWGIIKFDRNEKVTTIEFSHD